MSILVDHAKAWLQQQIHKAGWHISKFTPSDPDVVLKSIVPPGRSPTILDIGAWRGNRTAEYLEKFPGCTVHAFEPFPDSFKQMSSRYANEPRVQAHQLAVAAEDRTLRFNCNENVTTNSLLATNPDLKNRKSHFLATTDTIEVQGVSIDQFCEDNTIDSLYLVKLDIQGAELQALTGATKMLSRQQPTAIFAEVWFSDFYSGAPRCHELTSFLQPFGYQLFNLYDLSVNDDGRLCWADALYVHESHLPS